MKGAHHTTNRTMPPRSKGKRLGVGATCAPLLKYLHPSNKISEIFSNPVAGQRLEDCVAQQRRDATRRGNTFNTIYFTSATAPGVKLYCATRYAVVKTEGAPEDFFEQGRPLVTPRAATSP